MNTRGDARILPVVLAAGRSRRFGSHKLLSDLRGAPLVRHAMRAASDAFAGRTVLVAGHRWRDVVAAAEARWYLVNEDPDAGMGSSIALAARTLRASVDALLIVLADQPLVSAGDLARIVDAWSGDAHEIVASGWDGVSGPPVLLPSATFAELCTLSGDRGARELFADTRFATKILDCRAAATDVDRPEDLDRLR